MHFGRKLLAKRYEPWAVHYLDYITLKNLLEHGELNEDDDDEAEEEEGQSPSVVGLPLTTSFRSTTSSSQMAAIAGYQWRHVHFVRTVNAQVERVVHFFLQQQGVLSTKLVVDLAPRVAHIQTQADYQHVYKEYRTCAQELLSLVQFVELNVTGLRKILKKHDKLLSRAVNVELSPLYFGSAEDGSNAEFPVLRPLLEDGGLEALHMTLQKALQDLAEVAYNLHDEGNPRSVERWTSSVSDGPEEPNPLLARMTNYSSIQDLLHYARQKQHDKGKDASLINHQHHDDAILLLQIEAARRRLRQSSDFVRMLAAPILLDVDASSDEGFEDLGVAFQDRRRIISNYLNFCSTFLHMTDYYIGAPTSGLYAERLGDTAALAGLIIGLNSVSALVSTILYSWWTSYSYKHALIFASTCQCVGCLVYASALPAQSLTMVMLGRLIGGFGSARAINRRYIADTFPVQERTAASAGFVAAGALGTSAGPAAAALLYLTVPEHSDNLYWQVENSPGWTMACLWIVYIVLLIVYFEDPPRTSHSPTTTKVEMSSVSGEKQALLPERNHDRTNGSSEEDEKDTPPLWKIVPIKTTFAVYYTLKFILESLLSSTAILTAFYFDWSGSTSGIYLAILGLLVLPANWMIARASHRYDDRELMVATECLMFLGCIIILQFTDHYSVPHYLLGSIVIFVSANALEGPNMSLLSKTIPPRYSRGIFNVGLLATEAGNLGRATGDMILTLCGSSGLDHILNNAFGLMAGLSAATITLTCCVYRELEPHEKED